MVAFAVQGAEGTGDRGTYPGFSGIYHRSSDDHKRVDHPATAASTSEHADRSHYITASSLSDAYSYAYACAYADTHTYAYSSTHTHS